MDEHFTEVVVIFSLGNMLAKSVFDLLEAIGVLAEQARVLIVDVVGSDVRELVWLGVVARTSAAELHAGDGTEHERKANEGDVDEDVRDLLL